MLRNYLKIALRHLLRDRTFSLLNLTGLAVGMATFLLIFEFIASEWSANRFHQHFENLYRVAEVNRQGEANNFLAPGIGNVLKSRFANLQNVVRVAEGIGTGVLTTTGDDPKVFREERVVYSDGDFFRAFTFPFQSGLNTLDQPQTLALSVSLAQKLFGSANPLGKPLSVSNQFGNTVYTVTGVFEDFPQNSDLQTNVVLAFSTLNSAANRSGNDWADPATLQSGFSALYLHLDDQTRVAELEQQLTKTVHGLNPDARDLSYRLQPFRDLHLAPAFIYPFQTFGSLSLVASLAGVALLILVIAWVNYVNLSTAQSIRKAKEVGVRKVVGARAGQLVGQFLTETLLLSAGGVLGGLLLAVALQGVFNEFIGKPLSLTVLSQSNFWIGIAAIIGLTALASGGYVALVLSSFNPITALRNQFSRSKKGGFSLRQGLVVFQFGISVLFIVATLVMFRQLSFMQKSPLGLNLSQLLVLTGPTVATDEQGDRNASFKQELTRLPFVQKVAASNNVPGVGYNFGTAGITRPKPAPGDDKKTYRMFIADQNFFDVYGIKLTQGRPFTQAEADASWNNAPKVIINERAARQLGYDPKGPVAGRKLIWGKEYDIVGVVKDYHHLSMHQPIDPVIYLPSVGYSYFTIQTEVRDLPTKLASLEALYKRTFPGNPFDYFFADAAYDRQFRTERQLGQVFVAASLVAILIACLGIFGLAAFAAQQRTKEIGVRKVLGASVGSIVALLSKDFLKLVLVAIVIATPLAWYLMHRWLQDFAYQVALEWWIFALAGGLAIGIALLTVSFQSVRASLVNPVKSLKSE
ncbi:MAG: ABC transporter permease [Sphingobacteriaceae bacterium]|nr:ABC transporter permease [Cytophagaceae bacterium]